ncbi:hypothetical protein A1O7_04294 [Cladophialophora yegresii CBS 114405]|uniref:Uncharacterized protein n=1 Tax=Cladophialophora yegresii CBS 114405 TaxID=1182544 RepID=W9VWC8_9EURO|nr:uncharacterized protein A1O7_04294 [Cladophialophora yegresii CBS 114405]EXJ60142.1 hypothetical protein A1O7_04294 [Cladophialophora yegresii CBS 114405]
MSNVPGNTSSSGSPALLYLRTAAYSTTTTEPVPIDPSKLKKLGPLHEHLEIIRQYTPGQVARDIWTASALQFGDNGLLANENVDAGEYSSSWTFWEKMANTADALGTARYLNNAFDLHYLCFVEIFTDTGRRLSHWDTTPEDAGQMDQDQKASKVMASTPLLLQLLTRAVIGAARSCTTSADSKLARVMLDAAHCVFRQLKYATRVRALLILFDVYRNTLIDLWHGQDTSGTPKPHDRDSASPVSPKSSRLDQEYSLDDLVWCIHPAIFNREYFVVSTHLLNLSRYHRSWLSLPARSTAWEKPVAEFVRNLAIPSKTSQAWVRLVHEHESFEPPNFLDAYIQEAKAFLQWCTNAVFEGQTVLNGAFTDQSPSSHVVSRDSLNDARLTLYWFFVYRRKTLDTQPVRPSHSSANSLPSFPHSDNAHTTFDAFWVLSSFIFGFCGPEALLTSLGSISDYTLTKLNRMFKWPHGFVWHYLQQTICHASRLHADGDFLQQMNVQQKNLDLAILGATQPSKADDQPLVRIATELHPQPLPQFIDATILESHTRSSSKVMFTASPNSYHPPDKLPVKLPKRRWLQRLSLPRISVTSIQADSISKPSMSRSRTEPRTLSTPTQARPPRRSAHSWDPAVAVAAASDPCKVEEFPGDYSAIVPDLLYTTCGIEESSRVEKHRAGTTTATAATTRPADGGAIAAGTLRLGADKIASVVHSTEILLAGGRRPFVVLH